MDHDISEYLQDTLSAVEQRQWLADPARFSERVDALETIEFQILERIENLMYVHGHQADLALLYRRAAQLWQFLTNINDQLFQRLRDELASGTAPAATLRQQLRTYVTQGTVRDPVGYDDLDMFINGLFGMDTEPQETRPLKAGMIGYQATPARFILDLIERLPLGPDDVFFDLGSGLGRVALLVGLLTPARVRGIEYVDAREADVADGTVFFMYTPFRGALLQEVLDRLKDKAHRRPMTLVTYGPCTAEVAELDWLALSGSEEPDDWSLAIFTRR
jgi:hypothetical protein